MTEPTIHVDPDRARRTVENYLNGLESADFDLVLSCFADDVFYSHPPYQAGEPLAEAVGKQDLEKLIRQRRGGRGWIHEIDGLLISGDRCVLETTVREYEGGPVRSTSVGLGTFNADGLLTRWVALRSAPPVGSSVGLA
ncbi:nuclear transport factor 2 family protein [Georgenia sp. AZ-5]|uniref:nuclear transport factor 2 family protein n=1 Tax=Georgenia sp. AZ-5 TaxID=3367526 RepID=UPI003753EC77